MNVNAKAVYFKYKESPLSFFLSFSFKLGEVTRMFCFFLFLSLRINSSRASFGL